MENKEKTNSITLGDIFRVIWKNIILVAIVTVVVTIIGAVYTFKIVNPTYKASTQITVAVESSSDSTTVDSTNTLRIVTTIAELVETRTVLEPAAKQLGCNTEDEINAMISKLKSETTEGYSTSSYIVSISVTDASGDDAVKYANAIAENLIKIVKNTDELKVYKASLYQISPAVNYSYNSPNKKLYLAVAFLLGAVLALVIVFIKEFMSNKFKTKDEIQDATNDKVIGVFIDHRENKKNTNVVLVEPTIQNFEPYNNLFTNIRYSNLDNPYKVIMVSSTIEDELKSSVLCNLAYAIKNNNKKVCLIDLDLRKPTAHKTFSVVRNQGIVEYISGHIDYEKLIQKSPFGVDVITAGAKVLNPFVVIDSPKLKELINKLREEYDYVLIDTPPLAVCGDGINIAKMADGVIYNVTINQVRKKMFVECVNQLKELNTNIIGFNITKLPQSKFDRGYYYYYSYKYYGHPEDLDVLGASLPNLEATEAEKLEKEVEAEETSADTNTETKED